VAEEKLSAHTPATRVVRVLRLSFLLRARALPLRLRWPLPSASSALCWLLLRGPKSERARKTRPAQAGINTIQWNLNHNRGLLQHYLIVRFFSRSSFCSLRWLVARDL
jgi:hypothetical protein